MSCTSAPGKAGIQAKRFPPSAEGALDRNGLLLAALAGGAARRAAGTDIRYTTTKIAKATKTALIITRSSGLILRLAVAGVAIQSHRHEAAASLSIHPKKNARANSVDGGV